MTESPTSATVTDLTEYVDAAARAMYAHQPLMCPPEAEWTNGPDFDDGLTPLQQCNYREAVTPIVAAVAPLIERDARAAALEETCHTWQTKAWIDVLRIPVQSRIAVAQDVTDWLRDRAKRIREGR